MAKVPRLKQFLLLLHPMHFRNTSENPEGEGPLKACLWVCWAFLAHRRYLSWSLWKVHHLNKGMLTLAHACGWWLVCLCSLKNQLYISTITPTPNCLAWDVGKALHSEPSIRMRNPHENQNPLLRYNRVFLQVKNTASCKWRKKKWCGG